MGGLQAQEGTELGWEGGAASLGQMLAPAACPHPRIGQQVWGTYWILLLVHPSLDGAGLGQRLDIVACPLIPGQSWAAEAVPEQSSSCSPCSFDVLSTRTHRELLEKQLEALLWLPCATVSCPYLTSVSASILPQPEFPSSHPWSPSDIAEAHNI